MTFTLLKSNGGMHHTPLDCPTHFVNASYTHALFSSIKLRCDKDKLEVRLQFAPDTVWHYFYYGGAVRDIDLTSTTAVPKGQIFSQT